MVPFHAQRLALLQTQLLFLIYTTCLFCVTHQLILIQWETNSSLFTGGVLSESSETSDGGLGGDSCWGGKLIGSSCDSFVCSSAEPDTSGLSLDWVLSAEWGHVSSVLGGLELLNDLSQSCTISGSVFAADSDFLSSLCHYLIVFI